LDNSGAKKKKLQKSRTGAKCKLEIKQSKAINLSAFLQGTVSKLTPTLQRAVTLAQEKGASSWLTAFPVQEHGFSLHKTAFQDTLAFRYGWLLSRTPSHCACGTSFSIDMSFHVQKVVFLRYGTMK